MRWELRTLVKGMVEKVGLKDTVPDEATPHTFRHTWIKRMMGEVSPSDVSRGDLEIPLNVILDLTGHASADSLKLCTHSPLHGAIRS